MTIIIILYRNNGHYRLFRYNNITDNVKRFSVIISVRFDILNTLRDAGEYTRSVV